jgi:hypothetical protein
MLTFLITVNWTELAQDWVYRRALKTTVVKHTVIKTGRLLKRQLSIVYDGFVYKKLLQQRPDHE